MVHSGCLERLPATQDDAQQADALIGRCAGGQAAFPVGCLPPAAPVQLGRVRLLDDRPREGGVQEASALQLGQPGGCDCRCLVRLQRFQPQVRPRGRQRRVRSLRLPACHQSAAVPRRARPAAARAAAASRAPGVVRAGSSARLQCRRWPPPRARRLGTHQIRAQAPRAGPTRPAPGDAAGRGPSRSNARLRPVEQWSGDTGPSTARPATAPESAGTPARSVPP